MRGRGLLVLLPLLLGGLNGCEPREPKGGDTTENGKPMTNAEDARFIEARQRMVMDLETITKDRRILEVMGRVPRHEFVPEDRNRDHAYDTHSALSIKENQTISAPDIVAIMTDLLQLKGTERVLEIGTGSGYQAAVLGELVPEVYTVEILPRLVESSRALLASLRARGILRKSTIEVVQGDGYKGYEEKEPYDAIIVTAAPKEIPFLLLNQLKAGGRMVIPVGDFHQELQVVTVDANRKVSIEKMLPVRFVPMVKESDQ